MPTLPDEEIVNTTHVSPVRVAWLAMSALLVALTLGAMFGPLSDRSWEQPDLLFSLVAVAAGICVIGATIVMAIADRRDMAEVGLLGSALMAASVMPLIHALVTPGVLYDNTEAFDAAAFLSLPIAVLVAAPLLRPRSRFGRWAARHWRDWTLLAMVGVFALGSVLVFVPNQISVPGPSDPLTIVVAVAMMLALGSLSLRQLRFYELGRQPSNLIASASIGLLSVTALLPMSPEPYSPGFWWLHLAGALGVLGACVGLAVSNRMSRSAQDVLAPLLVRDPLAAFELGLSPVVHAFVSDLEIKDQMTRDHVVRTGELAMRVGERFRMSAHDLRQLGLAAMLHDVGKVEVPDEILQKPGRLTVDEYEVVKLHSIDGERMLEAEPGLAAAAPIVRSHHERIDGTGYPDGLVGREIPLAARIIAVCDALDAMTHDRQYRRAMPVKMASAILREHAGSQWDAAVVEQVISVMPSMLTVAAFEEVGRLTLDAVEHEHITTDDINELLVAVDVEI
jgi:HD-GYP domain-containing protein (c-di-GMP phosphodiesterase class II)